MGLSSFRNLKAAVEHENELIQEDVNNISQTPENQKTKEKKAEKAEKKSPTTQKNKANNTTTNTQPVHNEKDTSTQKEEASIENIPATTEQVEDTTVVIPAITPRKGVGRPKVFDKRIGTNVKLTEENYEKARRWGGVHGGMTQYINWLIENDKREFKF